MRRACGLRPLKFIVGLSADSALVRQSPIKELLRRFIVYLGCASDIVPHGVSAFCPGSHRIAGFMLSGQRGYVDSTFNLSLLQLHDIFDAL
jgi:hypothetical protein